MTDQPLLDWTPAHQSHSETSKAAAIAIKPRIGPMHRAILDYLEYSGGSTDEELQRFIPMAQNTERPRRRELQKAGLIEDSGKTRQTKSGRAAVVWVLATATPPHRGCSDAGEGTQ